MPCKFSLLCGNGEAGPGGAKLLLVDGSSTCDGSAPGATRLSNFGSNGNGIFIGGGCLGLLMLELVAATGGGRGTFSGFFLIKSISNINININIYMYIYTMHVQNQMLIFM